MKNYLISLLGCIKGNLSFHWKPACCSKLVSNLPTVQWFPVWQTLLSHFWRPGGSWLTPPGLVENFHFIHLPIVFYVLVKGGWF